MILSDACIPHSAIGGAIGGILIDLYQPSLIVVFFRASLKNSGVSLGLGVWY